MTMKGIEFKAIFDTKEMDAKIQQLQQKLRTLSSSTTVGDKARSIFGEGSPMTERAQKMQESFNEKNLQYLRKEFEVRDRLLKLQEAAMKRTDELLKSTIKGSEEEIKLKKLAVELDQKKLQTQVELNIVAEKYKSIQGNTQGLGRVSDYSTEKLDAGAMGQFGGGGRGGLMGALIKGFGGAAIARMLIRGAQGAANVGAGMYEHEQEKSQQQAGIAQGAFGTSASGSMLTGQGVKSMFFAQERLRAMQNAETAQGAMNLKGIGSTVGSIGGSALFGASMGAAAGKFGFLGGPVLGALTTTGAAVLGGVGGAAYGLGSSLMQGQTGAGIRSGLAGENPMEGIARYRSQKFFENYQANIKAEEEKDPYKQHAFDYFQQNKERFLGAQQISGMSDRELTGPSGFLSSAYGDFTTSQKLGAMQGISGAGGSTAQVRNANQALEMQRAYGTQNATGIVAGLSKGVGGGMASSDEVVRKIMSDAVRVGLDSSEFSREAEKFLTISAKFVEDSGARSATDQMRIAADMSSFVTGDSMKQVEAAGEARSFMETSMGTGGSPYQKALRMSAGRNMEGLSKLSEAQRTSLANMTPSMIKAGGIEIDAMIEKSELGKEGFEAAVTKMQAHGMDVGADTTARLEEIKKSQKNLGVNSFNKEQIDAAIAAAEKDPERKKALQELKMESGEYLSVSGVQQGIAGKSSQFVESLASGKAGFGEIRAIQGAAPEQAKGMYTKAQEAEAKMDQYALTNAMDYAKDYESSVQSIAASSATLAKALEIMSAAIKSGDTDRIKSASMTSADIMAGGTGRSVKPSSPTGVRSAKDR